MKLTKRISLLFALAMAMLTMPILPVQADQATDQHPHLNIIQKHPYATGFVAGAATHHYLKEKAARDKAMGKKLSWTERHPTLTALGVGAVTTHEIKKHTPHTGQ